MGYELDSCASKWNPIMFSFNTLIHLGCSLKYGEFFEYMCEYRVFKKE
jgi:hypothetical protein